MTTSAHVVLAFVLGFIGGVAWVIVPAAQVDGGPTLTFGPPEPAWLTGFDDSGFVERTPESEPSALPAPGAALDAGVALPPLPPLPTGPDGGVPGIMRPRAEGCPAGYAPVEGLCYHGSLDQELEQRSYTLKQYRRGVRPPLVQRPQSP